MPWKGIGCRCALFPPSLLFPPSDSDSPMKKEEAASRMNKGPAAFLSESLSLLSIELGYKMRLVVVIILHFW